MNLLGFVKMYELVVMQDIERNNCFLPSTAYKRRLVRRKKKKKNSL